MKKPVEKLPAKIVQIATAPIEAGPNNGQYVELFALCEDGSLWKQYRSNGTANVSSDDKWHLVCKNKEPSTTPCEVCNGFGHELTVYGGKILCRACSSSKVDEKTRADCGVRDSNSSFSKVSKL